MISFVKLLYKSLEFLHIVKDGKLHPALLRYWNSTQTGSKGPSVFSDIFVNFNRTPLNLTSDERLVVYSNIVSRYNIGLAKYGITLHLDNNRSYQGDLSEELADAIIYLWGISMKKEVVGPVNHLLLTTLCELVSHTDNGTLCAIRNK